MAKRIDVLYDIFKDLSINELINKEKELENILSSNEFKTKKAQEKLIGVINTEESDIISELNVLKEIIMVFNRIKELPMNEETMLATIINYNPQNQVVPPIIQGKLFTCIMELCKKNNIALELNNDELGGLGYYYKFRKIDIPTYSDDLKINKGLVAEDKETKEAFDDFKKELDAYNKNREGNLGDILDKFNNTFDIKDMNEDDNSKKSIKDIRNEIDEKIKELEEQLIERKTEDGIISDFSVYKREEFNDKSLLNNPTNVKIVIHSGLGLHTLSFIKRNNQMQFVYLNSVAVITDLDEKFVPISNEKYEEFILKLNNIIKDWNKVYLGKLNNGLWMVSLYDDEKANYRIIGSGAFPINWNEYIDFISDYEILYKKTFNKTHIKNTDIDEKFKNTTKEADELLNTIDKKLEELNKKEEIENIIENENKLPGYRLASPEIFKENMQKKSIEELLKTKLDLEGKINYYQGNSEPDSYMLSLHKDYLNVVNDLIAKKQINNMA